MVILRYILKELNFNLSTYTQQPEGERKKKEENDKEKKDNNKLWINEIPLLKDFNKSIYYDQVLQSNTLVFKLAKWYFQ